MSKCAETATSKFHDFSDEETASESFGFRGEALASISDISLLEITTKAIGRPNGYRKVMKVCDDIFWWNSTLLHNLPDVAYGF